eukprot:278180-Pyramimonas_sp.AAC.1
MHKIKEEAARKAALEPIREAEVCAWLTNGQHVTPPIESNKQHCKQHCKKHCPFIGASVLLHTRPC